MKKLPPLLLILCLTLTSASLETARLKINAIEIKKGNKIYLGLDNQNAKIMHARFKYFKAIYQPASNCVYSNMVQELETQAGDNFLVETEFEEYKKQSEKKLSFWKKVSLSLGAIIGGIIAVNKATK